MFKERCTEPSLDELFGDSAMRLLMRRDGVTESDIRALLCELKDARAVAFGGQQSRPKMSPEISVPYSSFPRLVSDRK
jgi:hypothetical protein